MKRAEPASPQVRRSRAGNVIPLIRAPEWLGVSTSEVPDVVFNGDVIHVLGAELDLSLPCGVAGGRPRTYPGWLYHHVNAMAEVYGSVRKAIVEIRGSWKQLQGRAEARYPHDPQLWLVDAPIKRTTYLYTRRRYMRDNDDQLTRTQRTSDQFAAADASELGLCVDLGVGSLTHPSADNVVSGDVTVLRPRFGSGPSKKRENKKTGEIYTPRYDPDARFHMTGTGERVWGIQHQLIVARGDLPNQRTILHTQPIFAIDDGGIAEVHAFVDAVGEIRESLPAIQAAVYDGAMRGVHGRRLLNQGVWPIYRQHKDGQGSTVRDRFLEQAWARRPDGRKERIVIHTLGGRAHVRVTRVDGEPKFFALVRTKNSLSGKRGAYRVYLDYDIPEEAGGGTVRLRANQTARDRAQNPPFNREEHFHAIAEGEEDFDRLYGRRADTESGNSILKRTLPWQRARSVGRRSQHLDLIAHQIVRNAVTVALWRKQLDNASASLGA